MHAGAGVGRAGELQCLADAPQQGLAVEGLGEIAGDAERGGLDRVGDAAVRGEQDDRQRRMLAADVLEEREAVAVGQTDVAQHEVEALHAEVAARGRDTVGGRDVVAAGLQAHRQQT